MGRDLRTMEVDLMVEAEAKARASRIDDPAIRTSVESKRLTVAKRIVGARAALEAACTTVLVRHAEALAHEREGFVLARMLGDDTARWTAPVDLRQLIEHALSGLDAA
jgi:hypothetical protein